MKAKDYANIYVVIYTILFMLDSFFNVQGKASNLITEYIKYITVAMGFILWVAMLFHFMKKYFGNLEPEQDSKVVWGIVILFGYVLGAFIYYVVKVYPLPTSDTYTEKSEN